MTLLWAQLIINDKNYGPHVFLVPIRDLKDHSPMTGVLIGDCGAKNGCNGIDNGFLIFKNCRIPRDNLLDKYSQVMSDGTFITDIPNPDKRYFYYNIQINFHYLFALYNITFIYCILNELIVKIRKMFFHKNIKLYILGSVFN